MSLALIIFLGQLNLSFAADKPQLQFGDKLSVFSDKAYRKNGGKYFEAVGNVVIISQKDTVYGELASLDQETMMVKMEGNVRVVTQDMTLYGSQVEYNITTGAAVIKNARILTPDFNLVARTLMKINENEYLALEAEFTTCKDCAESWSIYGKEIRIRVGQYVQIRHGLAKVKGVSVLYIPYIVLPILQKRKTGLLFPNISTRLGEGLAFEQPVFVALDDHKDMSLSPTFWAKRGWGGDFQYRQRWKEMNWLEFNSRIVNDTIYEPGETNVGESGRKYFRYFSEVESHQQWSTNFASHFRNTGARDLDMLRDNPQYTDRKVLASDIGLTGFANYRQNPLSLGVQTDYMRNQLSGEADKFDRSYVQVLPRVSLATTPYSLVQSRTPGLQHISLGMGGSFTRFRQVDQDEAISLRNADRVSLQPYLMWHFFTWGPVSLKSQYTLDQQAYRFQDQREEMAGKNAGIMKTEVSFTMDRIFGLAYEEKMPIKYIPESDLKRLRDNKEQGLVPIQKSEKENKLVGDMPKFEEAIVQDDIVQVHNSYRHSQEFKFIHHYIASQNIYGNQRFQDQITSSQNGWFDYEDALRANEFLFGANTTRTTIPPVNTMEFQWNNSIIRKKPKGFSYLDDNKYLRDNFTYNKIGYFDVSQGYLLQSADYDDYRQRLTRLMVRTGYNSDRWSVGLQEYYFHYGNENIFNMNFTRRFEFLNIFSSYNYNSFGSKLNTILYGGQVRPTDSLGLAIAKETDLEAHRNIRTIYSVDIMPSNNCWILNLNFEDRLVGSRYSFNIIWNFGQDGFDQYRNNYFGVRRL